MDPNDLSRHTYILGGSGSGKTTLLRILFKHLELANVNDIFKSAFIYVDTKDDDAILFLRQCEKDTLQNNVQFVDISSSNFKLNILELPQYYTDRNSIVSRMTGHVVDMFKEYYSQHQTFIQVERILRLLLLILYAQSDKPTLLDLFDLVTRFKKYGTGEVDRLISLGKIQNAQIEEALTTLADLRADMWLPILNRIEQFTTDPYMKQRFSVKKSSINFEDILQPGKFTIFQISDTQTPIHAHGIAITSIVMKIWFAVQSRAALIPAEDRTLVVLALDEFQKIHDLTLLSTLLAQARSYNLGLVLSHQNTSQISAKLLESIAGNTATQIFGRVSGIDAERIAKIMDPMFADIITKQIPVQSDRVFTAKMRDVDNEQSTPLQFTVRDEPLLLSSIDEVKALFESRNDKIDKDPPMVSEGSDWMLHITIPFYSKLEWGILVHLEKNVSNLVSIVKATKAPKRELASKALTNLMANGVITVRESGMRGRVFERKFDLMPEHRKLLFPDNFHDIGTAQDIEIVAGMAMSYYLEKGYFVCIAKQHKYKTHVFKTDLVAFDYDNKISISVEVESKVEVVGHPEQVSFNMRKWREMGFSQCHVWTASKVITKFEEVEDDGVSVFFVDIEK